MKILKFYWKVASFLGGILFTVLVLFYLLIVALLALNGCLFSGCRIFG